MTHVVESLGEPIVLVNNAGVLGVAPSDVQEEERWQTVLDVNLAGVFRCCQVVGRRMLSAGQGSIVNISSVAAELGLPAQGQCRLSRLCPDASDGSRP